MLRVIGLILIVNALGIIPRTILVRGIDFKTPVSYTHLGDIFRTVLQPFVLYHFYDTLYGSCFLFGGLVGFQFEDKAGFQAFL